MKPIRIEIWERCDVHSWRPTRTLTAGTWGQAKRKARDAMGDVVTTRGCYHRDVQRAPYAQLTRRNGKPASTVNPDVVLVPSCGEMGWW